MFWNYCDFQKWIKSGCEEVVVKTLSLVGNKLVSLHTLHLRWNQLTIFDRPQSGLMGIENNGHNK